MQHPDEDLVYQYLIKELKRGWLKWITASVLTLVGSALGAGWAAASYLAEIRARTAHAEYVATEAKACCQRQTERIDSLK